MVIENRFILVKAKGQLPVLVSSIPAMPPLPIWVKLQSSKDAFQGGKLSCID